MAGVAVVRFHTHCRDTGSSPDHHLPSRRGGLPAGAILVRLARHLCDGISVEGFLCRPAHGDQHGAILNRSLLVLRLFAHGIYDIEQV